MRCDEIRDVIPAFAQKEVNGEERIRIRNHLISCDNCREQYFFQLKLNYAMDRGSVLNSSSENIEDFKPEILHQIKNLKKERKIKINQWIWYAAAAILIIGFMVGRLTMQLNQTKPMDTGDITLSQLLASEDWTKLENVLTNHNEFNKYATDQIPINTLLEKLLVLRRMGVEKISIVRNLPDSNTDRKIHREGQPEIVISLSDFMQVLQQAKQQRSQISLADVSDILSTI